MKKLMYSTWQWDRAVKVAIALSEHPEVWHGRHKVESSRTSLDGVNHWRWHVYCVR